MDVVADVNGGNAEVACTTTDQRVTDEGPATTQKSDEIQNQDKNTTDHVKMDDQEINGDSKGNNNKKSINTPMGKRQLRRSKTNSTNTIESNQEGKTKNLKRKQSEPDPITSDDSMDFHGFDVNSTEIMQPGSEILRKLIAEAEALGPQTTTKRVKRSVSKGPRRNIEFKTVDDHSGLLDAREMKMRIDDATDPLDIPRSRKDSDKSDGESDRKSPLNRSKGGASATKQKASSDMSSLLYREPFKFGWKREIVYKGQVDNPLKKSVDIYYYTPKGKKVRSLREIAEFC